MDIKFFLKLMDIKFFLKLMDIKFFLKLMDIKFFLKLLKKGIINNYYVFFKKHMLYSSSFS